MTSVLTPERIEAAISSLPAQGRIMLRLLLLQYLDITSEDIGHIASDRPDPRMLAGTPKGTSQITQDTLRSVSNRVEEYRVRMRQKRERISLETECLRKQIAFTEGYCAVAERVLVSRFGYGTQAVDELMQAARTAVLKPARRTLEAKWEREEVTEEEYLKSRLPIEYQLLRRKLAREKKRMDHAAREQEISCLVTLQDHEIAHIWGIPIGTLTARKVKALHQYLELLQTDLKKSSANQANTVPAATAATTAPIDLWKETFLSLARRPIQRSVGTYDGLERTEDQLMEKLTALAHGTLTEDIEDRLWQVMTQESKSAGEYGSTLQSLFALQRYFAVLSEVDLSPPVIEKDLLGRIAPTPKAAKVMVEGETAQMGDLAEHLLRSFTGEDHSDTRAKR
jgi:hypothetical protein